MSPPGPSLTSTRWLLLLLLVQAAVAAFLVHERSGTRLPAVVETSPNPRPRTGLEERHDALVTEQVRLEQLLAAVTAPPEPRSAPTAKAQPPPKRRRPAGSAFNAALANPEFSLLARNEARTRLTKQYAAFLRDARVDADTAEQFLTVLAESSLVDQDVRSLSSGAADAQVNQAAAQSLYEQNEREIAAILGPDRYRQFNDYRNDAQRRDALDFLAFSTTSSGIAVPQATLDQLDQLWRDTVGSRNLVLESAAIESELLQKAAPLLSPAQLDSFRYTLSRRR